MVKAKRERCARTDAGERREAAASSYRAQALPCGLSRTQSVNLATLGWVESASRES